MENILILRRDTSIAERRSLFDDVLHTLPVKPVYANLDFLAKESNQLRYENDVVDALQKGINPGTILIVRYDLGTQLFQWEKEEPKIDNLSIRMKIFAAETRKG